MLEMCREIQVRIWYDILVMVVVVVVVATTIVLEKHFMKTLEIDTPKSLAM